MFLTWKSWCADLYLLLDPLSLVRTLDVHVLDADRSAVGITKDPEDLAKLHEGLTTEAASCEFAIEVPERQSMCDHIEIWMRTLPVLEWIDIGHDVT